MYLIDTNVISEMRNAKLCDKSVAAWLSEQSPQNLFLSVITIRELYFGAYRLKATDPRRHKELTGWIESRILKAFEHNILPIDTKVARLHAELVLPNSNISADSLIAATAIQNNLTVVTRNTKDFSSFKVRTVNPWEFTSLR